VATQREPLLLLLLALPAGRPTGPSPWASGRGRRCVWVYVCGFLCTLSLFLVPGRVAMHASLARGWMHHCARLQTACVGRAMMKGRARVC